MKIKYLLLTMLLNLFLFQTTHATENIDTPHSCESIGNVAMELMLKKQLGDSSTTLDSISNSLEEQLIVAGIKIHAENVAIATSQNNKLMEVINFRDQILEKCEAGQLGALQYFVNSAHFENLKSRIEKIELILNQLNERVFLSEEAMDSNITFRQETNRKLDQLATQIRNLQY